MSNEKSGETESAPAPNQDFVIREGFPALRRANGQPWLDGDEPLPQAPVRIFDDALQGANETKINQDVLNSLYEDCRTVFSARTRDDDQAYSAGVTYFLPAVMKPRCALEAIVQAIFRAHTACLPKGSMIEEQSGAEWWTLVLDEDKDHAKTTNDVKSNDQSENPSMVAARAASGNDGAEEEDENNDDEQESDEVGLHFDADYGLEEQMTNLFLHPRVATVTYLTGYGAPTVVMDRHSPQQGNIESLNGDIRKGWVSHPRIGRHLAFDGRLLHGAPATFFPPAAASQNTGTVDDDNESKPPPAKKAKVESESTPQNDHPINQRITLLVNVWVNHCPLDAEPLDDDVCSQLKTPSDALRLKQPLPKEMAIEKMVRLTLSNDDPAGEEEVVIGDRIVTAHYAPTMDELHEATTSASAVVLEFEKDALKLVVGGLAPQDEDEDEDEQTSNQ